MGKAKKGSRKAKKQPQRDELRPQTAHELLGEWLYVAKNNSSVIVQTDFCNIICKFSQTDPEAFLFGNYQFEIPIAIVLALGRHPDDTKLRTSGCFALLSLIDTPCMGSVFKYGAKIFKEFVEEHFAEEDFQEDVIGKLRHYLRGDISNAAHYDSLGKVDFQQVLTKAMRVHIKNSEILVGGAKILASLIEFCGNKEKMDKIIEDTIGSFLAAVDEHLGPLSPLDGSQHITACLANRSCDALSIIMENCPSTVPVVGSPRYCGPRRVLAMMGRDSRNLTIQACGCIFLSEFTHYDQSNVFQVVVAVLRNHSDDVGVRLGGFRYIAALNDSPSGTQLFKFSEHHHPFFLNLMKKYKEPQVQLIGCIILHFCTCKVEAEQPVTDKEAVHLLADALKSAGRSSEEYMLYYVVPSIGKLLERGDKETVLDALLKEDFYKSFATTLESVRMKKHTHKDDLTTCRFLRKLSSSKREDNKLEIATSGCAAVIIDCMKRSPGNEAIQTHGCEALGLVTINKDTQIFEAISKVDGVNIILDAVDRFPKNKTIFNFGGSAAILTREYEDDKKYGKLDFSRCG